MTRATGLIFIENFREREGDDEGDRAISMRTSESAKVMGDQAYLYENFGEREGRSGCACSKVA